MKKNEEKVYDFLDTLNEQETIEMVINAMGYLTDGDVTNYVKQHPTCKLDIYNNLICKFSKALANN